MRRELEKAMPCSVGTKREHSSGDSELGQAINGGGVRASSKRGGWRASEPKRERRAFATAWSMRHSCDSEVGRQGHVAEEVRARYPTWTPRRH